MDWTIFFVIVAGGLLLAGAVALMLRRAWGEGPRAIQLPAAPPPARPAPPPATLAMPAQDAWGDPELPAGAPAEGLIPVLHPQVRAVVAQAIERGGAPPYFIRQGDTVYLALYRIPDPQQRALAERTMATINGDTDGNLSLGDMLRVVREIGRT